MRLNDLDKNTLAISLIKILHQSGNQARFIGGCVRDAYINNNFSDIDIATTSLPDQTLAILSDHNINAIRTGIKFGTITAVYNNQSFEITTLRRDLHCNGRHAIVEFTDNWEEDAARRDFTINALSYALSGKVYDYFNGIDDLKQGIVKFVGIAQERIQEDYLRILRLFRFFAYYGKTPIDSATLTSCQNNIEGINILSGERIQSEMYKILQSPNFSQVLHLMYKIDILSSLIGSSNLDFTHLYSLNIIEQKFSLSVRILRRLAALLYQLDVKLIDIVIQRWKLSLKDQKLLHLLSRPKFNITGKETSKELYKMIRISNKQYVYDLIVLHWSKDRHNNLSFDDQQFLSMLNIVNNCFIPKLPITGNDLLNLGIPTGQHIGRLLEQATDFWEENNYASTKEEIINFILLK